MMIITNKGPQSIGQMRQFFSHGDLFLSPEEYQRENAWGPAQKQLLVDSIFRGMDIPKFYLWKIDHTTLVSGYPEVEAKKYYKEILEKKRMDNEEEDPYIFEVVDGQQRIRTILEFMGVKPPNERCYRGAWHETFPSLPDTPMAKGKRYSQLNAEQQIKFELGLLTVMVLEKANIDEIRDMFTRLQNGTPLNAQQKRDAMGSAMGRAAKELAGEPFFSTSVTFGNRDSAHHLVASQMLLLELKEKVVSCTSIQIEKVYEHYKKASLDVRVVTLTKNIIGVLGKIFPQKNQYLNQNYALSLYWLLSRIRLNYDIPPDQYPKIRENFEALDLARMEAMVRDYNAKPGDDMFLDLSLAMSRGNTGMEGITTRHDIIGQFLFDGVQLKEFLNLDPMRNFMHEEKLILFHRAKGCCQLSFGGKVCGREIPFDDAVVDHIEPHSKGGRTTLVNGRIAYKSCNIARSNRDTFNPETYCSLLAPQGSQQIEQ